MQPLLSGALQVEFCPDSSPSRLKFHIRQSYAKVPFSHIMLFPPFVRCTPKKHITHGFSETPPPFANVLCISVYVSI